uniref:DUF5131 family protein n=1 Tax=viral metagenome TaxID=1070528 RepID=A0A6M3KTH1_9ZZZZ
MQKSKIEWTDYTLNPVKGLCPVDCKDNQGKSYCYARRMYKRYKWDETIRFAPAVFNDLPKMKAGSRVFVGSTIELFGKWIDPAWMMLTLERVKAHPELTFIFLTKQPQNLLKYSPLPGNCWVGVSATDQNMFYEATKQLVQIEATVKFISVEPMLGRIFFPVWIGQVLDWLILGSQTQPTRHPPKEKVDEIITAADKSNIPVFVKEPMASHYGIFRQEFPA